jgi:hypothetical protein
MIVEYKVAFELSIPENNKFHLSAAHAADLLPVGVCILQFSFSLHL